MLQFITLTLPFLALASAFFFLIYIPQKKAARATIYSNVKIGDKIITRGGLIGTVHHKFKKNILIQLYDGSLTEITYDSIIKIVEE